MQLGKVSKLADGFQVIFERKLQHPAQKVWEAITNSEMLKYWFTDIEMDFRPGGKITFLFRDDERSASYGEIVSIDPPHLFEYTWEGELASWQIIPEDAHSCMLKLTYSKLPDVYAINAPTGFHSLLDRLENTLDGDRTIFPFGKEELSPEDEVIKNEYTKAVLGKYPELQKFQPIVIEKLLNASIQKVWQAITDKDHMKKWYFDLDAFVAEPGYEFSFAGQGHKGEKYIHRCKILEVIPYRKLRHTWTYENFEGESIVTFDLSEEGHQVRIKLTHSGLHTFPQDNPDFARDSFNGGWTELITVLLPKYLESEEA
jgi:uncharacterized protein YndB with AHSA1/START domain